MHYTTHPHVTQIPSLNLYLVSPVGYEEHSQVVVARDANEALRKVAHDPDIRSDVDEGTKLDILNLTKRFSALGYDIFVTQRGVYH